MAAAFYSARVSLELRDVPDPDGWAGRLAERVVTARTLAQYGDPGPARARADWIVASLLPGSHVSEVVRDGAVVGVAWLGHEGDTTDVYDAWLDDPADGPALREVVLDRARSWSSVQLRAGVVAGNAGQRAMVDGGGFTLMATNLRLDLDGPLPEPGDVRVEPMSEGEFDTFFARLSSEYAVERERAGESRDRAVRTARKQLGELLPVGRASAGHRFLTARQGADDVGYVWLDTSVPTWFVYDVAVHPDRRGRGVGRAVMQAAARTAATEGAIGVGLNVFAHNVAARRLYDRLGYRVTEDHYLRAVTP